MNASEPADPGLLALAEDFREALRHSIYLVRRLDADGELSAAQLSTLKMLLDAGPAAGGVRVGEIARNLGVKVPSATEQIIKLERAGLARREPDPDDSRAVRVTLTDGRPRRRRHPPTSAATPSWPASSRPFRTRTAPPSRPPCPVIGKINATLQA